MRGGLAGLEEGGGALAPGLEDLLAEKVEKSREKDEEQQLSSKVVPALLPAPSHVSPQGGNDETHPTISPAPLREPQPYVTESSEGPEQQDQVWLLYLANLLNLLPRYNLVSETLILLDCICGSTTGTTTGTNPEYLGP